MRTILFVFKTIKFEIFRIYTCSRKSFAQILDFDSRFSIFESFSFNSICKRYQKHFVIYLFSNWFTSIVSKIENNEILMKISFLKEYWFEKVTKIVVFELLVSDFSTLKKSLFRKSSKSCLFVFILFVRFNIHLKKIIFEKIQHVVVLLFIRFSFCYRLFNFALKESLI